MLCVCVFQRFGPPDQDYYYKKTDEAQADARQDREEDVAPRDEGEPLLLYTDLTSAFVCVCVCVTVCECVRDCVCV